MAERYDTEQELEFYRKYWSEAYGQTGQFGIYLLKARELSLQKVMPAVEKTGLSTAEFDALTTLRRSAPPHQATPTELQRSMLITSGGLTKILYQLEEKGLVSRSTNEQDKRVKYVNLTSKGKSLVEKTIQAVHQLQEQWLEEALTKNETDKLIQLLGKSIKFLEGEI